MDKPEFLENLGVFKDRDLALTRQWKERHEAKTCGGSEECYLCKKAKLNSYVKKKLEIPQE